MSSQTSSEYERLHQSKPNPKLPPAYSVCAGPGALPAPFNTQYQHQPNRQLGMAHGAIPSLESTISGSYSCDIPQYIPTTSLSTPASLPVTSEQRVNHISGTVGQHPSMSSLSYSPEQNASTGFDPCSFDSLQSQTYPCLPDLSNSPEQNASTDFDPCSFDSLQSQPYPCLPDLSMSLQADQHSPDSPYEEPFEPGYLILPPKWRFETPQMYQSQTWPRILPPSNVDEGYCSVPRMSKPHTSEPHTNATHDSGYLSSPPSPVSITDPISIAAAPLSLSSNCNSFHTDDNSYASVSSGPTMSGVGAITSPHAAQASCSTSTSEIQNSSRIIASPASPTQKIRTFPRLGFNTTNDDESYTNHATPENGQSPGRGLRNTATNIDSSSARSDLSSSGWTEDGRDAETLRLISISSNVLVSAYMKLATNYISNECENGATDNSPPCKAPSQQTQQPRNSLNGRKRKLNRSDSGSDDFDDNGDPKRQKTGSTQSAQASSDNLPLACPFNKYDSILFGPDSPEEAYHACATCSFVNIAYLKQHLQRNHYMPKHYCFRCCRRFTSQAMAASHMRQHPPCEILDPPLYRERIDPDMIGDLGLDRKNPPGTDRVEYWYRLYNAFFPGAADRRPVSPYYEGPAAQHMGRFLHFARPALPDLLPEVQQRLGLEGILPGHHLVRLMEEILQDAIQRYLQQPPGLGAFQIGQADSFTTIGSTVASQPEAANSNPDANNEAAQATSTPPLSTQGNLRESTQPSTLSTSMTSGSTTESTTIPRTPPSTVASSRTLERLTAATGPLTQGLPVEPANNGEGLFPFDANIAYSPGFDWAAELDSMDGVDWSSFCHEVSDEVKRAAALGSKNAIFD